MKLKTKKKYLNKQIFRQYFEYQYSSSLAEHLHVDNLIARYVNDTLTDLRNTVIRKEIPGNENLREIVSIVQKNPRV